jgi:hypothetical protein
MLELVDRMLLLLTSTAQSSLIVLAVMLIVLRKIRTGNSVSGEVVQEYSAERYRPL